MTASETIEIGIRVFAALGLGAAVGLERQWRSRLAGVRTNALVSGGSALFVILGSIGLGQEATADPTRVAAQVVSGIGFLGAGVILRDGLNIRGINTAATLWCSAAVGSLTGAGLYWVAGVGAIAVVATNTVLRPVGRMLNRRDVAEPATSANLRFEYLLEVRSDAKNEQRIRVLVLQATNRPGVSLRSVQVIPKKNSQIALSAEITADPQSAEPEVLERAMQHIGLDPKVQSVRWWDARAND